MSGLYDNSTSNFLRNCQDLFHSGCILHCHQQCVRSSGLSMSFSLPVPSHRFTAILEGGKWHLILICIYLMTKTMSRFSCAHWLFVYLLWRNVYSNLFFFIFRLGYLYLLFSCKGSLYILDTRSLSDIKF